MTIFVNPCVWLWQAICPTCKIKYQHIKAVVDNPYPNGIYCPKCRSKYAAWPVLNFSPVIPD